MLCTQVVTVTSVGIEREKFSLSQLKLEKYEVLPKLTGADVNWDLLNVCNLMRFGEM